MEILIKTKFEYNQTVYIKDGPFVVESRIQGIVIQGKNVTDWPFQKTGNPVQPEVSYLLELDREKDERREYHEDQLFESAESAENSRDLRNALFIGLLAGASVLAYKWISTLKFKQGQQDNEAENGNPD